MNILQDDLSLLTKPEHFLGWLGEDPSAVIRDQLEEIFKQQIATAWLGQLIVTAPPRFLTGARRYEEHENLPTQEEITAAITAATSTANTESKNDRNDTDNKTNENTATDEDSYTFVLVRAGLAMPFKAIVCQPGGIVHEINGVLTWVATGLDTEDDRKENVYIDLDDAAESATDLLEQRLYEPDEDDTEESESGSQAKTESETEHQ